MATPRPGGFPSPSLSARSERLSRGAARSRTSNSSSIPPPEGKLKVGFKDMLKVISFYMLFDSIKTYGQKKINP